MESQTLQDVLGDKRDPNPGVTLALQEPQLPDTSPRPHPPGTERPPSGAFSAGPGRAVLRKYPLARCYFSETKVDMNGGGNRGGIVLPGTGCSELAGPGIRRTEQWMPSRPKGLSGVRRDQLRAEAARPGSLPGPGHGKFGFPRRGPTCHVICDHVTVTTG